MHYEDALGRLQTARSELAALPAQWVHGKRCLDVGCGGGNFLLAAVEAGAAEAVGIDIDLDDFGDTHFERLAAENRIAADRIRMVEGRTEHQAFPTNSFDLVTMYDVIEHDTTPAATIAEVFRILRPGGIFLLDVSPLYYSPVGHHLFSYFSPTTEPWAHLYKDFDRTNSQGRIDAWSWRHFVELNKLTCGELDRAFEQAGFTAVKYTTLKSGEADYPRFADRIDPALVPSTPDLFVQRAQRLATKRRASAWRTWLSSLLRKAG
jgi:ubiquinone/menaquinone biosynthesis C-methylase UbiE